MQHQTPRWLTLFVDAHGTKGVIALAWWVGARHAMDIRDLDGSFPFLQVLPSGPQPSALLATLAILSGAPETPMIRTAACTPSAFNRTLFAESTLPLVIEEEPQPGNSAFDWDSLKPLFNNCTWGAISRSVDPHRAGKSFARAIAILTSEIHSPALQARTVQLNADQAEQIRPSEIAFQLLQQLGSCADALSLSPLARRQLIYRVGGTQRHIDMLQEELGNRLPHRHAKNYAQLISLVHAVDDIFHLPEGERSRAIQTLIDMADTSAEVPF